MLKGVYIAQKKDGTMYFRSSITYKGKHISLGSFDTEILANKCYLEAYEIIGGKYANQSIDSLKNKLNYLSFHKMVSLVNFRDNSMYIKNPLYILPNYFLYYYSAEICFKFDVDDLFYFSKHKIMKRNGHLFVEEYGMQTNILSRYGIKNYAVAGKDYIFVNGDTSDFRYNNIRIINKYTGVSISVKDGKNIYLAKIHVNGDYIIGRYNSEEEAAVAYNKASKLLFEKGIINSYQENYIDGLNSIQYASIYASVKLSKNLRNLLDIS